jgi:peptide/nickel transport system substrate-binding protein
VRAVPSESARVAALISGEADIVTSLTPKSLERIESSGRADVLKWQNNRILALGINFNFAPFDDEERGRLLRQAIAYAIPYDEIIRSDYLGDATQWKGLVESTYHGYREDGRYTTDIAKARELMAQAGFPDGRGLPADSPAFTLNYVAERQTLLEPIATRIKTALAQIGITIRLAPLSQSELATRELAKFDMGMWLHDYTRPIGTDAGYATLLWYVAKDKGGLITTENYNSQFVNDTFFKSQTTEGDERLELLGQIQERMMEDLPKVPIVELPSQLAVRKGVTGWFGQPYDLINFFYLK